MDRRSWTLLLALAAIWGASYLLIEIGLRDLDPGMIAFVRIALAAVVLVPLAASRGALRGLRGAVAILLVVGAIQIAGPFVLIPLGQQEIASSLAGILVASTPIFTAILAIRVDHEERAHGLRLVGIVIGVVGVGVLLGIDLTGSAAALLGGLAVVGAALGYAIGGLLVKHRLRGIEPLGVAAGVMVAATVLLIPVAAISLPSAAPAAGPLAAVVVLGLIGTGVAFALFYELMARVGPGRTFVVTYLAPGFAVVYGVTLLDEAVTVARLAGLALIVGGAYLAAEGRIPSLLRAARPHPPGDEAAERRDIALPPTPSEARQARRAPGRGRSRPPS